MSRVAVPIEQLRVAAYTIPTDAPESDGTLAWDSTTIVIVELSAGGRDGIGYSYTDESAALLIHRRFRSIIEKADALAPGALWRSLVASVRNLGVAGIAATAISAVDNAAWDLKAKLFDVPLLTLLGALRPDIAVYGSGGFTSYTPERLQAQLHDWVASGITRVKMKIGRAGAGDIERVSLARAAIGDAAELFVDANGAYRAREALGYAEAFADYGVSWFEEPVVSDDLEGLHWLRSHVPARMAIAAGEYGWEPAYFRRMLQAQAVDVLQADATRCLGITGFMQVAGLCAAFGVPLSAHTAPSLHAQPCCAAARAVHVEYFHDHARIESAFFDGFVSPLNGRLTPDASRPGLGLELKRADAAHYQVWAT